MPLPHGVIAFPVTPMRDDESIDLDTYRGLLDRIAVHGTNGVAPGSTTGEAPYLSARERRELLEVTVEHLAGRTQVIASAAATSTREAIDLARHAQEVGADGVLANVSQFFPLSMEEVRRHFLELAASVELPIILYNQPLTGVNLDPETIAFLARETDNIRGVKESSGLVGRVSRIRRLCDEDFVIYCGHGDVSLPSFLLGAKGWFTALPNLEPEVSVRLYEQCERGDWAEALATYERLAPLSNLMYGRQLAANIKAALGIWGFPVGRTRRPLSGLTEQEASELKAVHITLKEMQS